MNDFFLKAANEADLDDALLAAGLAVEWEDEDGLVHLVPTEGVCLDIIGEIPDVTGWHVNVRTMFEPTEDQLAALSVFELVPPDTPYRIFA